MIDKAINLIKEVVLEKKQDSVTLLLIGAVCTPKGIVSIESIRKTTKRGEVGGNTILRYVYNGDLIYRIIPRAFTREELAKKAIEFVESCTNGGIKCVDVL